MSIALRVAVNFINVNQCCVCGVPMALTESTYIAAKRDSKYGFFCERGHIQYFTDGEVQRLKKELERKNKELEWSAQSVKNAWNRAEDEKRSAAAARGVATRLKNRIKNGVCPCCNRSFENLKKHMLVKHPEFAEEK
jgi:hypothetical protein